jgi:hypothetical protein
MWRYQFNTVLGLQDRMYECTTCRELGKACVPVRYIRTRRATRAARERDNETRLKQAGPSLDMIIIIIIIIIFHSVCNLNGYDSRNITITCELYPHACLAR